MGCSFMTWVRNTLCQNWLKPPSSKSHCHGCMLDFHPDSWFSNHSIDDEDEMGGIPTKSLLIDNVDLNRKHHAKDWVPSSRGKWGPCWELKYALWCSGVLIMWTLIVWILTYNQELLIYLTFTFTFPSQLIRNSLIFISIWQTTKATCLPSPSRLGGNGCKRENKRRHQTRQMLSTLGAFERY